MDLRLRWIAAGWESVTAVQRINVDEPSNCEGLPPREWRVSTSCQSFPGQFCIQWWELWYSTTVHICKYCSRIACIVSSDTHTVVHVAHSAHAAEYSISALHCSDLLGSSSNW